MAIENHWRARKIRAELSKLGIELSLATIARYLPKPKPHPDTHQRWLTFLEPISEMAQQNAGAAEQNEAEEVDLVSLPAIRQPAVAK